MIEKFSSLLSFLSWTDRSTLLTSGIKSGFPSSSCAGEMCGNSHNRAKPSHGTGLKAESPLNFSPRVPCRFTTGGAWCVSQGNSPPRSAIRSGFNVEGSGHSCIRGPVIHRRRSPTLSSPPSMIENHTQVVRKYLSLLLSLSYWFRSSFWERAYVFECAYVLLSAYPRLRIG